MMKCDNDELTKGTQESSLIMDARVKPAHDAGRVAGAEFFGQVPALR
jgi:hypothetical protein